MFIFIPYFSCYSELVKSIKLTKFLVLVSSPIYRFLFCSPARRGKCRVRSPVQGPMVTSSHDVPGAGADTAAAWENGQTGYSDLMPGH